MNDSDELYAVLEDVKSNDLTRTDRWRIILIRSALDSDNRAIVLSAELVFPVWQL